MNELEMIKAFAELEGVEFILGDHYPLPKVYIKELGSMGIEKGNEYNPLLPNELNLLARDKYGVTIEYMQDEDHITLDFISIFITDRNTLCKTIIECILKSEGLWK